MNDRRWEKPWPTPNLPLWQSSMKTFAEFHDAVDNRLCLVDLTSIVHIKEEKDKTIIFFVGGLYQEVSESYQRVLEVFRHGTTISKEE